LKRQVIGSAIHAVSAGYTNPPAPEYRKSCVVELPFTIVRGRRTFVALDSDGLVVWRGILEPGGDMDALVDDLYEILHRTSSAAVATAAPVLTLFEA